MRLDDGSMTMGTIVYKPKHGRWFNVLMRQTGKCIERVPASKLVQENDDIEETASAAISVGAAATAVIAAGRFAAGAKKSSADFRKGDVIQMKQKDGSWHNVTIIRAPKHGRWYDLYSSETKQVIKRAPISVLRNNDPDERENTNARLATKLTAFGISPGLSQMILQRHRNAHKKQSKKGRSLFAAAMAVRAANRLRK